MEQPLTSRHVGPAEPVVGPGTATLFLPYTTGNPDLSLLPFS